MSALYYPLQYAGRFAPAEGVCYREYAPAPQLADRVACYWSVDAPPVEARRHRVLADGCIDLVFDLTSGSAIVTGIAPRTMFFPLAERVSFFGIRFLPSTIPFILHDKAARYQGQSFDAALVFGGMQALREAVVCAPSLCSRLAAVDADLCRRFAGMRESRRFAPMLRQVLAARGNVRIEELAAGQGLSARQLGRWFGEHVGMAPREFAGIVRFQNLLLSSRGETILPAALALGYCDQAHACRDIRRFLGDCTSTVQ